MFGQKEIKKDGVLGMMLFLFLTAGGFPARHQGALSVNTMNSTSTQTASPIELLGTTPSPSSTPDIPAIISAMLPVASGKGVPETAEYNPDGPGTHPLVILTTSGQAYNDWNENLPDSWSPSGIDQIELVALIGPEQEINLGSQAYNVGPDITAFQYVLNMELREAHTGQLISTFTFTGTDPRPFPATALYQVTRLEGTHFGFPNLEDWLCPLVSKLACWSLLPSLQTQFNQTIYSIEFSPDGQTVAGATSDNSVKVWRVSDSALLATFENSGGNSLAFSLEGQSLATASNTGVIQLWKVSDGSLLRTMEGQAVGANLLFSPDGQTLAGHLNDGSINLWNVSDGTLMNQWGDPGTLLYLASFSPNGQILAIETYEGDIQLWRVSDKTLLNTLDCSAATVVFSPDGQTLACGETFYGDIRLWQVSSGALLRTLNGHANSITALTFSPDGQILASGSIDNTARLWSISNGALLQTLEVPGIVTGMVFSPDGQNLTVSSNDGSAREWQVSDGALLRDLFIPGGIFNTVFSPDGQTLAMKLLNENILLWQKK